MMGKQIVQDFILRDGKKFVFYKILPDDFGAMLSEEMRIVLYLEDTLGAEYAIERTPYSTRVWLDDEEDAVAFGLFSSWSRIAEPHTLYENPAIEYIKVEAKIIVPDFTFFGS
jgi:hypothetical protein